MGTCRLLRITWLFPLATLSYASIQVYIFHYKQQIIIKTYSEETGGSVPELCCRDNEPPSTSSASVCKNSDKFIYQKKYLQENTLWENSNIFTTIKVTYTLFKKVS